VKSAISADGSEVQITVPVDFEQLYAVVPLLMRSAAAEPPPVTENAKLLGGASAMLTVFGAPAWVAA
jgi:hypothetical protein